MIGDFRTGRYRANGERRRDESDSRKAAWLHRLRFADRAQLHVHAAPSFHRSDRQHGKRAFAFPGQRSGAFRDGNRVQAGVARGRDIFRKAQLAMVDRRTSPVRVRHSYTVIFEDAFGRQND